MMRNFTKILKWNSDHYGSGSHGGQFRPHSYSDYDDGGDDDSKSYLKDLPPPRYRNVEPEAAQKRIYTKDPKSLVNVFKQFNADGCGLEDTPEDLAKKWAKLLPKVHPHEFLRAFLGHEGVSNENLKTLKLSVDTDKKLVSFKTTGGSVEVHGAKVNAYHREINLEHKVAYHNMLELDEKEQGKNLVKTLFKSVLPLYDKIGLRHIGLFANLDRGGYAWSKYGFTYWDSAQKRAHQKQLIDKLHRMTTPTAIRPELPPSAVHEKEQLMKVLTSRKAESLWALTDMKTPALDAIYKNNIAADSEKGSFIKLLTKHSEWSGILDLKEGSPSRKRLEQYL